MIYYNLFLQNHKNKSIFVSWDLAGLGHESAISPNTKKYLQVTRTNEKKVHVQLAVETVILRQGMNDVKVDEKINSQ